MSNFLYYAQLVVEAVAGVFGLRLYEEPAFEVTQKLDRGVEIRQYGERVAAEVAIGGGTQRERSDKAFPLLFDYIAGANKAAAGEGGKIAMTVPVEVAPRKIAMTTPVEVTSGESASAMRFFLPSGFTVANAPEPTDSRVRLVQVPGETLAVLRFSGSPGEADLESRKKELLDSLRNGVWKPAAQPVVMFYDAPFTLPFVRRNEVAVRVERRAD